MREYIYIVNGTEFYAGTAVWGDAWKEAQEAARAEHAIIERTEIHGFEIHHQFLAKGGCFLDERFYKPERAEVF